MTKIIAHQLFQLLLAGAADDEEDCSPVFPQVLHLPQVSSSSSSWLVGHLPQGVQSRKSFFAPGVVGEADFQGWLEAERPLEV